MSKKELVMAVVLGILVAAVPAQAQTHEGHGHNEQIMPYPESIEVGNKICPVSDEEVGGMGDIVKVEYNGMVYNLCCAMCKRGFLKDPEKYSAIAEAEAGDGQYEEGGYGHEGGGMHGHHGHEH